MNPTHSRLQRFIRIAALLTLVLGQIACGKCTDCLPADGIGENPRNCCLVEGKPFCTYQVSYIPRFSDIGTFAEIEIPSDGVGVVTDCRRTLGASLVKCP